MSTQLTPVQQKFRGIQQLLLSNKEAMEQVLPRHITADRMVRVALTSLRLNPKLLDCDPKSFLNAMLEASALGLEPDSPMQQCHLIPYGKEIDLQMNYHGLLELVYRAGEVSFIGSYLVYENEEFKLEYGLHPILTHSPMPPSQRGELIGAYAIAQFKDGRIPQSEWMWKEDLDKVKKQALENKRNLADSPWTKWPEQMYRKTVIKRLCNYLKRSPELARAIQLDSQAEAGVSQRLDIGEDVIDIQAEHAAQETQARTEEMRNRIQNAKMPWFWNLKGTGFQKAYDEMTPAKFEEMSPEDRPQWSEKCQNMSKGEANYPWPKEDQGEPDPEPPFEPSPQNLDEPERQESHLANNRPEPSGEPDIEEMEDELRRKLRLKGSWCVDQLDAYLKKPEINRANAIVALMDSERPDKVLNAWHMGEAKKNGETTLPVDTAEEDDIPL